MNLISIFLLRTFSFTLTFTLFVTLCNAQSDHAAKRSLVLMCLSAHPDDEDGATLLYYSRLRGVKTYSIFFTRGEGGQNATGSELYEDLGSLRTKETLEAAKILGTEALFLGFTDFGFSKTAKETFAKWGGKDSVLAALVYVIRALKPDVIITTHDTVTTKPNRQHGHHQTVGITAYEAFDKAADKQYHPEQFANDIVPWQVKKLFFRTSIKSAATGNDSIVTVDISQRDSSRHTIGEIAVSALKKHRTQGFENLTIDSMSESYRKHRLKLIRGGNFPFDSHDLFSGILPSPRTIVRPPAIPRSEKNSGKDNLSNVKTPEMVRLLAEPQAPGAFIGLVKTYDNTLEETLKLFRIKYQLVDSTVLATGNLSRYTTIVLDLRTYYYRSDAVKYSAKLLEYVFTGGNIVCFYHKPGDWNSKGFAPYPLLLTSERVTEEDAPVSVLLPHHPLITDPLPITPNDWSGWVQERSIYLPSDDTLQSSSRYERLLAMSDADEHQPSTSLLWTRYGKGTYTYVSLALYRQLHILQDGAVKLLINLLSQSTR